MTPQEAWIAVRRRWPVMILGMCLTLATCVAVWRAPGVYWASTRVYFLAPVEDLPTNPFNADKNRPLTFVGLIQDEMNEGPPPARFADPNVTLVDEGIDDGWSVRLPDYGGQWASDFRDAVLIVQASGPSQDVVQTRMDRLIERIRQLVTDREDSAGVAPSARITFQMSPPDTAMHYSRGYRSRSIAVILALGLALSVAACEFTERVTQRRDRR